MPDEPCATAALRIEERDWQTMVAAATHMRQSHGQDHPRYVFWHELAAWIETIAAKERGRMAVGETIPVLYLSTAIILARDYVRSLEAESA